MNITRVGSQPSARAPSDWFTGFVRIDPLAQPQPPARAEVHPGDVVWFPPDVSHWHGATPTTAMSHIAVQESQDGKVVDWLEAVSDEDYRK